LLDPNPFTTGTTGTPTTIRMEHPDCGLLPGDTVVISGATDIVAGLDTISASDINGERTVVKIDYTGLEFTCGGAGTSNSAIGGGDNVTASQNYLYNIANLSLEHITPSQVQNYYFIKATTGESYPGTETGYQIDTSYRSINVTEDNVANEVYVVANTTNEANNTLGLYNNRSLQIMHESITRDEYVTSPLDLQRCKMAVGTHRIDNPSETSLANYNVPMVWAPETNPNGGSAAAKHVMRPVQLEIPAKGLKILYAGNIPNAANIDVYYRTSTADVNIYDQEWTLVSEYSSNPKNNNKVIYYDYEYNVGGEYESTLDEFDVFQVKFVFRSYNQARVPSMKDVRVIAITR
jgi:hypothetical protein